ncbi:Diaminohydroxyphosphoribosylaminopyrimidine deaminase [Fimbriiglobus ruber]|uniref:Riboflavin biosynthesis protein RibD n=2 Tax=Fimbriiglobus ruber TaxID=1908690 RepID=A0A225DP07_9BACT|nr:Diaminohydroxyphosphoribosylaminopyrimidine deaminase [Fimbriiglobus ruber]
MKHAVALAAKGRGAVEPNPMVGAVVLAADGSLVGEGWHQQFGGPHAEVHAFAAAGERARGGTLYVTLEPCCHHGKTPPCSDAVLRAGVRRVVAAMADPFPKVAGGGLAILRAAGLEVTVGTCEAEARRLNAPYLKLLQTGLPWVIAKWAMSLDGKIATRTGDSRWISGEESRRRVHELRGRVDAIMVGSGTVFADDPQLTARPPGPRRAARVVVTASGFLPKECHLRATARDIPVLIATGPGNASKLAGWADDGAEILEFPAQNAGLSAAAVLTELGRRKMTNVLAEGGAGVFGTLFDEALVDEAWVFVAPKVIGGAAAPSPVAGMGEVKIAHALSAADATVETIGADVLITARLTK